MENKKKSIHSLDKKLKDCFIICPIGDENSEIRKRSDSILKYILSPTVEECGYKAIRADNISEPGLITTQIIQHIADDPMIIADLTNRNANVFYELALRHALRKPVIQIIDINETIPFDIGGTRIIKFDYKDLGSVDKAKKEIKKQIKNAERIGFKIDNPISAAIELQSYLKSSEPEDKNIGDFLSSMQDVQKAVARFERKLSNPEEILPPAYVESVMTNSNRNIDKILFSEIMGTFQMIDELNILFKNEIKKPSKEFKRKLDEVIERKSILNHYFIRNKIKI